MPSAQKRRRLPSYRKSYFHSSLKSQLFTMTSPFSYATNVLPIVLPAGASQDSPCQWVPNLADLDNFEKTSKFRQRLRIYCCSRVENVVFTSMPCVREHQMKQALMVIASAWSTAFIILFFAFAILCTPISPTRAEVYGDAPFILLAGAVTGVGWLWFRRETKKKSSKSVRLSSQVP